VSTYDDIYLHSLVATSGLKSYVKTMFTSYGVDIRVVPVVIPK
jgi:hypothetical protein